jgi:benzoyl-CoA 2,3-dioxygenase component A
MTEATAIVRQHLIDPEICIRCNTCEETCPIDAITHDARNYVVDPAICDACNLCIAPCPTGAIDSWRQVAKEEVYTTTAQFGWDALPAQAALGVAAPQELPQDDPLRVSRLALGKSVAR